MKAPLVSGNYQARSVIASAQRCLNQYTEKNGPDAPFPFTNYPTPGLTILGAGLGLPSRCAYTASNGDLYEVIGSSVYYTNSSWVRTLVGLIGASFNYAPVSMSDNGLAILIVDGSASGWCIDMATRAFAEVAGQDGAFYGADRVDFVDTFFLLNRPGTNQFYISLSNVTFANLTGTVSPDTTAAAFDPLDIAAKAGNPDPIQGVIVMHREPWLIGSLTSEVWYNAGAADFAFAELPGVFIEHGCVAKYSIAKQDLSVFWLSADRQGQSIVMMGNQYTAKRITTHAIEQQIQSYYAPDAIGFTYQQLGHTFYVLTFPSADATWVYDVAEDQWHERASSDGEGVEHRWRCNNAAAAYGVNVAGDWETGALYQLDLDNMTDDGSPIMRRRGFPLMQTDNVRVEYTALVLDMDPGEIPLTLTGEPPEISLRYSDDRGKNWGNPISKPIGSTGQYETSPVFTQLGQGRNRVFEVFWDGPFFTAINGGNVFYEPGET